MTDKERLEEIKKVAGLDYLIGGTKVEEHWDWLIKQAEKVELLEKRLNELAQTSYCIICGDVATEVRQGRFYCQECCN